MPADEAAGSRVYADYITEQLSSQEKRKESFESRGAFVITTSGALATILLGLSGFASGNGSFELPDDARTWLTIALLAFVAAGVLALLSNVPLPYRAPLASHLAAVVENDWGDSEVDSSREVSRARLDVLAQAAKINTVKGWILLVAMAFEVGAISAVATAVWRTL